MVRFQSNDNNPKLNSKYNSQTNTLSQMQQSTEYLVDIRLSQDEKNS